MPIRTIHNISLNPNIGGRPLLVSLGCEKMQPARLFSSDLPVLEETGVIRLQDERGFMETVGAILRAAEKRLAELDKRRRVTCPASELIVGLQCGGSDAFSGVTCNPAVGFAADLLVRAGATVMFSEVTEVRDAVHLLTARAATREVALDLVRVGKVCAIGSSTFPASEIVEAQWVAEHRGLVRFRTEQPPYSILNRSIEREVLPICEKYGMGALVWSPLAKGMLTGRYRKGQALPESLRVKVFPKQMSDERNLEAVERLIPIAEGAGMSLTHLAIAFVMAHPGVTSAILGPRTMQQLDDLLAGAGTALNDEILDKIDEVVPPGTDAGPMGALYIPQALTQASLRRRADRTAV